MCTQSNSDSLRLGESKFLLLSESLSSPWFSYQLFQPLEPCYFLFCTDDPPPDCFSIRGRLSVKEIPCGFVLPQPFLVRRIEIGAPLLVRINAGEVFFSCVKRGQAGWLHQTFIAQLSCALDVDRAPNAPPSPGRKSNGITQIIDPLTNPVDPAKAERFIHRLRPGYARLPRALLVITDP